MAELLTEESFKGMHRFKIRQMAKKMGMDKDEAMKTKPADLVDWILENQNGESGGGDEEETAKSAKKGSARSAKSGSAKSSASKSNGRSARGGKAKAAEEEPEEESGSPVDTNEVLEKINRLETKVDAIGEIADKNIAPLVGDMQELRADVYKLLELVAHLYRNMENEEMISPENAPDEMCCDDKLEALEKEVGGEGND